MAAAKEQKKAAASDSQPTQFTFSLEDFPPLSQRGGPTLPAHSYTAVHERLSGGRQKIRDGFVKVKEDKVPQVSDQAASHEPVISTTIAAAEEPGPDEDEFLLVDLPSPRLSSSGAK